MSLRNLLFLVLSFTLVTSAFATSTAVSLGASFNPLEHVSKDGDNLVSLNGAQLLDAVRVNVSDQGAYADRVAVAAFGNVARSWPTVEEAPAASVAPEAKPKTAVAPVGGLTGRRTSQTVHRP